LDISWTAIIQTVITSAINGATVFLVVRYTGKLADKIEKVKDKLTKDDSEPCNK
jgi:large-conductance mechanosensitive channel